LNFRDCELPGVKIVDLQPVADERGFFARTYCIEEFADAGICDTFVQDSVGFSKNRHTLRGLHFHAPPFRQTRYLRCTAGKAFCVAVDLRPTSPSYLHQVSVDLDSVAGTGIYVPSGIAVGYLTLTDSTAIFYQMSLLYDAQYERGVRWNDPAFDITWPAEPMVINDRDKNYPDFDNSMTAGLV
jgi:dTDP-4-dehydrorhamnose 3,5-epimerase